MNDKRIACAIGCVVIGGMLGGQPARGIALTYHPVTPCRLVDTREGIPNPLAAGEVRAFNVTTNLQSQGGTAAFGGCLVPPQHGSDRRKRAEAIVVNLVAVNADGPGDLRVFAGSDAAAPLASVINYVGGQTIAVGTTIPLRTDQIGEDFKIQADVSGTHVVVDVIGYYSRTTTTTFAARLQSIPGSTGDAVTVYGPITGAAPVVGNLNAVTLDLPSHCTAHSFWAIQTVAAATGFRAFSLRKTNDVVIHSCTLQPGEFLCESKSSVFLGEIGARVYLQSFSAGAVPATDALITFQVTCD